MEKHNFNSNWKYRHDGREEVWTEVTLPHDAMLSEKRSSSSLGGSNTGWFEGYDYCYEKCFDAPEEWKNQSVTLEFEGVYHRAEVWINGTKAAYAPNGYLPFRIVLDDLLRYGQVNVIRVIARNADQPNSRWYSGAGIYRPVWLYIQPKQHICLDGIKVHTKDYRVPTISVSIDANCDGEAEIEILDYHQDVFAGKAVIKQHHGMLEIPLESAELWMPEKPKLYQCRVRLYEDVQQITFGIRTIEYDVRSGFRINGERIILKGACIHHDNGLLGAAAHPYAEKRKIRLLLESGYNAIRSAHNPCSAALLEACDQLGMLVLDEYVDMWYIHKTQYDYAEFVEENWKQDLKTIVDRDYNHPAVVMYSIGNEVSETAQAKGIQMTHDMTEWLHTMDDRPVTCGINIFFNFLSSMGFGVYSDEKAQKAASAGSAGKKAVGSEFFNNLAGLLGADFMKFGATLHGSDRKTKDAFAALDIAGYNYGINRYEKDLKKYPNRIILGSETFCSDASRFWELAKKHPAVIGDFVWVGMDYLGEVGIGAWDYKDYVPAFEHEAGWITAGSGRLDITGRAYGELAYTQVAFEMSPIRIGVVPADHAFDKHSPSAWRMSNTFESWSWNGCEGKKTRIEVYARGCRIRLLLNGRAVGEKRTARNLRTVFTLPYEPGTLTAIALDEKGNELYQTSLTSAADDTEMRLLPEQTSVGTNDLCYVKIKFTDKQGVEKPLARSDVRISVKGGQLLGLGNGCPYHKNGYLDDYTDTYYGEALAIIKPGTDKRIEISAVSSYGSAKAYVQVS